MIQLGLSSPSAPCRGKWYRRQLKWQQQRRLISHIMMLVVSSIALLLQLISGMSLIFRAQAVRDPADVHNLLAVPCLLTTAYLWDLAYSRCALHSVTHNMCSADQSDALQSYKGCACQVLLVPLCSLCWSGLLWDATGLHF